MGWVGGAQRGRLQRQAPDGELQGMNYGTWIESSVKTTTMNHPKHHRDR